MDRLDCIVIGVSVAGTAAALRLAEEGRGVALVEAPGEIPLRARTYIWNTPLSKRDRTGADFESLAERTLDRAGVRLIRDVESHTLAFGGDPQITIRRFDDSREIELAAPRMIYASDGTWNTEAIPAATSEWAGKGVSASAWVDSTFYIGKSAAVIGGGDFAFEQLYWAGQCLSELSWLCTDRRPLISEELLDRVELPVIPKLYAGAEVKSVSREAGMIRLTLGGGEAVAVHAAFFAFAPRHSIDLENARTKGMVAAGSVAGIPWTHHAGAWQSGWDAAGSTS